MEAVWAVEIQWIFADSVEFVEEANRRFMGLQNKQKNEKRLWRWNQLAKTRRRAQQISCIELALDQIAGRVPGLLAKQHSANSLSANKPPKTKRGRHFLLRSSCLEVLSRFRSNRYVGFHLLLNFTERPATSSVP